VDSHCHLFLLDRAPAEVLDEARAAGVGTVVVPGIDPESSRRAVELAESFRGVFATAGMHPHDASAFDERAGAEIEELLANPHVVAVGECGLDFFRMRSPAEDQERTLRAHVELARHAGLPLVVHVREAWDAILRVLGEGSPDVVIHCFTGTRAELFDYLDRDWHIGITGWLCDERRGQHLREIVPHLPLSRLMVETDSPYLLPRTLRPMPKDRRNEPAFLAHVVEELARDRGEAPDAVAAATTATARAFFRLPAAP
jgi:TatD DNase family protein